MKKLLILLVLSVFVGCSTTRNIPSSSNKKETTLLYKIKRINKKKTYYQIYATRNGFLYRIFSECTTVPDCEKIKVGKLYPLNLKVLFPIDSLFGIPMMVNLGIRPSASNGKYVRFKKRSHYRIYNARNLTGLCIE